MTFLSAASQFSLILTMPLSAYLCLGRILSVKIRQIDLEFGWSSVYYLLGVVSGIVAILFFAFYRNTPDQHPWVSVEELNLITKGGLCQNK
jgi:sugar phosphate permease